MTMVDQLDASQAPRFSEEMYDRYLIEKCIYRERDGKDLGRWDDMLESFHPDARMGRFWFQGTAREFIASSRKSFEAGARNVHILGPVEITLNGDRALAQYNTFIRANLTIRGVDAVTEASVRTYHRMVKFEGRWVIQQFNVVYQCANLTPLNPWEEIDYDRELLASYPRSYRYVAFVQNEHGFKLPKDIVLGVDDPAGVEAFTRDHDRWLASG